MGSKLNQDSYRKLIEEDIRWLVDNTEHSLERQHIVDVLWDSVSTLYGTPKEPRFDNRRFLPPAPRARDYDLALSVTLYGVGDRSMDFCSEACFWQWAKAPEPVRALRSAP